MNTVVNYFELPFRTFTMLHPKIMKKLIELEKIPFVEIWNNEDIIVRFMTNNAGSPTMIEIGDINSKEWSMSPENTATGKNHKIVIPLPELLQDIKDVINNPTEMAKLLFFNNVSTMLHDKICKMDKDIVCSEYEVEIEINDNKISKLDLHHIA